MTSFGGLEILIRPSFAIAHVSLLRTALLPFAHAVGYDNQ